MTLRFRQKRENVRELTVPILGGVVGAGVVPRIPHRNRFLPIGAGDDFGRAARRRQELEPVTLVAIKVFFVMELGYAITINEDPGTPGADRSVQPFRTTLLDMQQH